VFVLAVFSGLAIGAGVWAGATVCCFGELGEDMHIGGYTSGGVVNLCVLRVQGFDKTALSNLDPEFR
jgi:hypothetical protein